MHIKAPEPLEQRKRKTLENDSELDANLEQYPEWEDDPMDHQPVSQWEEGVWNIPIGRFYYFFQHIVIDWERSHYEVGQISVLIPRQFLSELGIPVESTQTDIVRLYRKFLHETHPDFALNEEDKAKRIERKNRDWDAWHLMCDPFLRERALRANGPKWDRYYKKYHAYEISLENMRQASESRAGIPKPSPIHSPSNGETNGNSAFVRPSDPTKNPVSKELMEYNARIMETTKSVGTPAPEGVRRTHGPHPPAPRGRGPLPPAPRRTTTTPPPATHVFTPPPATPASSEKPTSPPAQKRTTHPTAHAPTPPSTPAPSEEPTPPSPPSPIISPAPVSSATISVPPPSSRPKKTSQHRTFMKILQGKKSILYAFASVTLFALGIQFQKYLNSNINKISRNLETEETQPPNTTDKCPALSPSTAKAPTTPIVAEQNSDQAPSLTSVESKPTDREQKWKLDSKKSDILKHFREYPEQIAGAEPQPQVITASSPPPEVKPAHPVGVEASASTPAPQTEATPKPIEASISASTPTPASVAETMTRHETRNNEPQYTTTGWHLDNTLRTCPTPDTWLEAWNNHGAVATLVVVCENGKNRNTCDFSKDETEPKTTSKPNNKIQISPYGLNVDNYKTVCEQTENGKTAVYRLEIRK